MALEKTRGRKPGKGDVAIVVGAGRSGMAVTKLLRSHEVKTRLLERNPEALTPDKKRILASLDVQWRTGEHMPDHFADATFVIPSPAMPISYLDGFLPADRGKMEIVSEMELSWRYLDDEPVLAVTGTSGKTTTASLAAAMLKAQGYTIFLGGNIGTPLAEYLLSGRKADVLVLEISSFQLQGCSTFCPRVGVLLNISPNHLDYHKDMAEYIEAKFRLFRCQDEGDLAVLGDSLRDMPETGHIMARKIFVDENSDNFSSMRLLGRHNAINAESAWQATRMFGVTLDNARTAVKNFVPLPHRLELVRSIAGVDYINDSKCTTVSSLKVALEAMNKPVRLLCGGKFKGGDLDALVPLVSEKVVEILLFGASREHFEKAWAGAAPSSWHRTLAEAVQTAAKNAVAGDVVLLAPATASFDLYKNYMARGEDFRKIVEGLQ